MRSLTEEELGRIAPRAPVEFVAPLNVAMSRYQIITPVRQAAFLAQCAHESNDFTDLDESLYYTNAERVRAIFRRFDALDIDDAWGYLNQPERLANRVYANRLGNGDESSGDGWKYRGRGLIQITGKDNYRACANGTGLNLLVEPEILVLPAPACLASAWWWKAHGCNALADSGDFDALTRRVNGPAMLGREARLAYFDRGLEVLA